METVAEFLQLNPVVGTFEWVDLVEQAIADREDANVDSLAILKVRLHTEVRKQAYERWTEANPAKPLTDFNARYAVAAVERIARYFELSAADIAKLQSEFGLPKAESEEKRRGNPAPPANRPAAGAAEEEG